MGFLKSIVLSVFLFVPGLALGGPANRALIAVMDLHRMTSKQDSFHQRVYQREVRGAGRMIERIASSAYDSLSILQDEDATFENFEQRIESAERDPAISSVDVIIYLHGHSAKDYPTPEICFVSESKRCLPVAELPLRLRSFTKLRMIYSDACHGHEHMESWLQSGFKVASGSRGVDTNFYTDLKRFLKLWVGGGSFQESMDFANRGKFGDLLDRTLGGDSFKETRGDGSIAIDSF
jgi:hypothetical protein